jgi:hypothetical protein
VSDIGPLASIKPASITLLQTTATVQRNVTPARGPVFVAPNLTAILGAFPTFDDLVPDFAGMVREVLDLTRPLFERSPFTPDLEFLIAGWSAKNDRPECYVLATHNGAGLPAWELVPAMDGWLTHEELIQRLQAIGVNFDSPDFDPAREGLKIALEQRARRWKMQTGQAIHCMGGFIQLTTVEKDRTSTRILTHFADQIGALVDDSRPTEPAHAEAL